MEDSEMSRWSRQDDTEGIAGGQCERGLKPLSLGGGGLGDIPPKIFKILVLSPAI